MPLTFRRIKNKGQISNLNDDLVYGYTRILCEPCNIIIPVDIIKIIIFYGQDGIHWVFNKLELAAFHTAVNYNKICSKSIFIQKTEFNYFLKYTQWRRCMHFGLQLIGSMPQNIEYIELYCELRCIEFGTNFKGVEKFGPFQIRDSISFNAMRLGSLQPDATKLTFVGVLDVLCVKYKQNHRMNNDPRSMNLTKMRKSCEFEWSVPKAHLLRVFDGKYAHAVSFYSSNFNHECFVLSIKRGCYEQTSVGFKIELKLLRAPPKVKKMDIKYCVKVDDKTYSRTAIIMCGWCKQFDFECIRSEISTIKAKNVHCIITVIKAFDYNDKQIPEQQFLSYDIF